MQDPQAAQLAIDLVETDFSLTSNGRTYIERNGEASQVVERIQRSSASVIGIAGVRGAGKSSLSKKVLDACSARGYFTLLIPSPISYEPREFLLAIFQRIVESALQSMTAAIEGSEDLVDMGRERARQVRRALIVLSAGILFSVATAAGFQYYSYNQYLAAVQKQDEEHFLATLKERKDGLTAELNSLEARIAKAGISVAEAGKSADAAVKDLSTQRSRILDDLKHLDEGTRFLFGQSGDVLSVPMIVIASAVVYVIAVFLAVVVRRLYKRYRRFAAHPKEVGLFVACRETLELITYQATLSSSKDIGVKFQWLSGKLTTGKQLAERPLSLPGLTATCTKFLSDVADVFALKVVICVDELDKITDAVQLMELLKGIKGILGQDRTHFLLTISEDAMGNFTERLSSERNLIESSFQQIVYLDRLPMDLAREVIRGTIGAEGHDGPNFDRNCALLWIFAGGIPREIKRNVFTIHSGRLNLGDAPAISVWKMLYLDVISPMQITPPRSIAIESQFNFLRGLEALLVLVHGATEDSKFQDLMESFSHVATEWFKPLLSAERREVGKTSGPVIELPYLSLIAQIVVGFLALGGVVPKFDDKEGHLDSFVYVAKYVPINPRYALYGLRNLLGGRLNYLYEDTESTAGFEQTLEAAAVQEASNPVKGSRRRRSSRQGAMA